MYFLSQAMRFLPVDITYASFAEVCILGTAFVRIFKFDQALSLISALGLGLKIFGVLFATLFIIYRVIIWPMVSFSFWKDCLLAINENKNHDDIVYYFFLISNAFLTILQIVWLKEVITTANDKLKISEYLFKQNDNNKQGTTYVKNANDGSIRRRSTRNLK